jgi:hypothetical protein
VQWILFPAQALDAQEVNVLSASRWPTELSRDDFRHVTGEAEFPPALAHSVVGDRLAYFCNTRVNYALRGVQVRLNVLWDYQASPGAGDTHFAVFRGTRSRVEVRQGPEEKYRPELYVVPRRPADRAGVLAALRQRVERMQGPFPGVAVTEAVGGLRLSIPDCHRIGHEAHFAEVTEQFLRYLEGPDTLPAWERPNMLAKYHTTTRGVKLARSAPG